VTAEAAEPDGLPTRVLEFLRGGYPVVAATVDEDGAPMTTLVTWIVAIDARTLRLAMSKGASLRNVERQPTMSFEILGEGFVWGVRGTARVVKETMETCPFPSAVVEIALTEVRDHSHRGVIVTAPTTLYAPGKTHRYLAEDAIFSELRAPDDPREWRPMLEMLDRLGDSRLRG
jgi:hypothetical protein